MHPMRTRSQTRPQRVTLVEQKDDDFATGQPFILQTSFCDAAFGGASAAAHLQCSAEPSVWAAARQLFNLPALLGLFRHSTIAIHTRSKVVIACVTLVYCCVYGVCIAYVRSPTHATPTLDWYVVAARASGQAAQVALVFGSLLLVRGFNQALNKLPPDIKRHVDWRRMHKVLIVFGCVFAVMHVTVYVVKLVRDLRAPLTPMWMYSLITGLCLLVLLVIPCTFYPFRRSRRFERLGRLMFRYFHAQSYALIAFVLLLHSYSVTLMLIYFLWRADYLLHHSSTNQAWMIRYENQAALVVRTNTFSPTGVGAYYQLSVAGVSASYSAISIDSRTLMFMIGPCVLLDQLDASTQSQSTVMSENLRRYFSKIVALQEQLRAETTEVVDITNCFEMYGPFDSISDDVYNHHKCLIITSGMGHTVRDAFVAHQLQHKSWDRLICLHMASRTPRTNPTYTCIPELASRFEAKGETALVEHISGYAIKDNFWEELLELAVPCQCRPLGSKGQTTASVRFQAEDRCDERRFVVVVCGAMAERSIQATLDQVASEDQRHMIHVCTFH